MAVTPDELRAEQRHFDEAAEYRERSRHTLAHAAETAANPKDAVLLRNNAAHRLGELGAPDEAVAFGRLDFDDGERYYLGRHAIHGADTEVLVVNWQMPGVAPYYEANVDDPMGVARRRTFACEGNTVVDIDDVLFADLVDRVEALYDPDVDDALLQELDRGRSGEMHDIVETIRAAQYAIIRADIDQLLVVQGGPGTGKTAVALHRLSWLLYNHRDELGPRDVLVVGPSQTFVRYIRHVLPSLGDQDVAHMALTGLGPSVSNGRTEEPEVARLKGDDRMADLLDRALRDRISLPEDRLEVSAGARRIRLDRGRLDAALRRLRNGPYAQGRRALRDVLRAEAREQGAAGSAVDVDALLDRIWPQLTAPAFLQELLASRDRLLSAAGDDFSAREVQLLQRTSARNLSSERWTEGDIPLLDHVQAAIAGQPPERYSHIVIDEAQDLSPMQLRSIARRSIGGSMTVLGDIAQSTGPWARDSWDEVVAHLKGSLPMGRADLEVGYRVPAAVYELAASLLPEDQADLRVTKVVREGPPPTLVPASDGRSRAEAVVEHASRYAGAGLMVGVICPRTCVDEVRSVFESQAVTLRDVRAGGIGAGINLLLAEDAKGLEFDAVVVVEPEEIVASAERGDRLLYVALTRTTTHLAIVHVGPVMPDQPDAQSDAPEAADAEEGFEQQVVQSPVRQPSPTTEPSSGRPALPRSVTLLVDALADDITSGIPPEHWAAATEALKAKVEELLAGGSAGHNGVQQ